MTPKSDVYFAANPISGNGFAPGKRGSMLRITMMMTRAGVRHPKNTRSPCMMHTPPFVSEEQHSESFSEGENREMDPHYRLGSLDWMDTAASVSFNSRLLPLVFCHRICPDED